MLGVWNGFSDKMEQGRKVMEAERDMLAREQGHSGPGTAIVLASIQEKTAVAFKEKYGKLGKVTKYAPVIDHGGAMKAGYQEGRNLNLNRPIGNNQKVRQLPS